MHIQPGQLWSPIDGTAADLRLVISVNGSGVRYECLTGTFACTFREWTAWVAQTQAERIID